MCPLDKIASCQISFTPMISKDYLSDIQKVIELIAASGLEYDVGILSTTIRGNKNGIFMLLKGIYDTMEETCSFTMDVKISNLCGCSGTV